jgi:hypothetical protein
MERVLPTSIRIAANPGETVHKTFNVNVLPFRGTLTATVSGGDGLIRVNEFVATKSVYVPSINTVPDDNPPGHHGEDSSG